MIPVLLLSSVRELALHARNYRPQRTKRNTQLTTFTQFRLNQHFRKASIADPILDAFKWATALTQATYDAGIGYPVFCQSFTHLPACRQPMPSTLPSRLADQAILLVLGSDSITDQSNPVQIRHHVLMQYRALLCLERLTGSLFPFLGD